MNYNVFPAYLVPRELWDESGRSDGVGCRLQPCGMGKDTYHLFGSVTLAQSAEVQTAVALGESLPGFVAKQWQMREAWRLET